MPGEPRSARVARHWSVAMTDAWGLAQEIRDDVALAVSELVANAAVHGGCQAVACRLTLEGERVRVEVREWLRTRGPVTSPTVATCSIDEDEHGRGLALVEGLSLRWGWQPPEPASSNGSCVWALFGSPR